MPLVTLRPNAELTGGGFQYTSTGSNAHSVTSDNNDNTYISALAQNGVIIEFGTFTLPTNSRIEWVQPRVRATKPPAESGSNEQLLEVHTGKVTSRFPSPYDSWQTVALGPWTFVPNLTYTTWSGPRYTLNTVNEQWSQADINDLMMQLTMPTGGGHAIYELYFDVQYNTQPTVTVNSPTGTTTTTTRPTVQWTYNDTESNSQQSYHVKIFSAAQYGAAGFDPSTSTATFDSSEKFNPWQRSYQITGDLSNQTYRAYVRVSQFWAGGGGTFYSNWAFSGFVVDVDAQPTPALNVVTTNVNSAGYILMEFQGFPNLIPSEPATTFEDGTTTGWVALANTTISSDNTLAFRGSRSLRLTCQVAGDIGTQQTGTSSFMAAIYPSVTYAARARVRSSAARNARITIHWMNSSNTEISRVTGAWTALTVGTWTELVVTGTSATGSAYALVRVDGQSYIASEILNVDNVGVNPYRTAFGGTGTWAPGGRITGNYFTLERTLDGVTWVTVREFNGYSFLAPNGYVGEIRDHEAPPGVNFTYKVRHFWNSDPSTYVSSADYVTASFNYTLTDWWLKAIVSSLNNMKIDVEPPFVTSFNQQKATYHPLGRAKPVVITDDTNEDLAPQNGQLTVSIVGDTDYKKFKFLVTRESALLLQSPFTQEQWYIRPENPSIELQGYGTAAPYRVSTFSYIEVERPD